MGFGEEIVTDFLVVGTATEVEEVDGDFFACYVDFLYTVIDSDCSDILLYEPALTVALDDA